MQKNLERILIGATGLGLMGLVACGPNTVPANQQKQPIPISQPSQSQHVSGTITNRAVLDYSSGYENPYSKTKVTHFQKYELTTNAGERLLVAKKFTAEGTPPKYIFNIGERVEIKTEELTTIDDKPIHHDQIPLGGILGIHSYSIKPNVK